MLRWTQAWSERISDGFPEEGTFRFWEYACVHMVYREKHRGQEEAPRIPY